MSYYMFASLIFKILLVFFFIYIIYFLRIKIESVRSLLPLLFSYFCFLNSSDSSKIKLSPDLLIYGGKSPKFISKPNVKRVNHGFHMVTRSPWPLLLSIASLFLTLGLTAYMHRYIGGEYLFVAGFFLFVSILAFWWRDVIREATFEGKHTRVVQRNHKFGFVLFIISEIMFFFAFFWAFFHSSLSPSIEIGCIWPPMGIVPFNPWKLPLLNTFILLLSGLTITICHHAILLGDAKRCYEFFRFTIFLASLFTIVQLYEYRTSSFSISDGIYGSTFFMATGFHGLHVLIGTIFITICYFRMMRGHFTRQHHVGFECAAWYWHFVDIVWLFLFAVVYWWGGMR